MKIVFASLLFFCHSWLWAQNILLQKENLEPVSVQMSLEKNASTPIVKVVKDSTVKQFDEATFVRLKNVKFKDGTIELKVLSKLLASAPAYARGFIGVAFRIDESNSKFECIYIRPTNGRANDQVRRNHSIQYFAFPDYKFERLRKESPEKYESYSDMALDQWIKIKIVVKGTVAKLYLNDNSQPALIVNDLKHGSCLEGSIGLFVDIGTEGYFSDLKISK